MRAKLLGRRSRDLVVVAMLLSTATEPARPLPGVGSTAALPPNILLVMLDDVGVDLIGSYAAASDTEPACTPTLDLLAARGVLFESAWAAPTCSPTRAQILTGRYGFRTGVGTWVSTATGHRQGLAPAETTLAELLAANGYSTALFGKWHLATANQPADDPLAHGFDWFAGSIPGTLDPEMACPTCPPGCRERGLGYRRWVRSLNGAESCEERYATEANVADALATISAGVLPEPWFVATGFNAIHSPFHTPPSALCPGGPTCACSGPMASSAEKARAALEALDTELRRLVANLAEGGGRRLWVIVVSDNGTPAPVATGTPGGCFDPGRSKGTLYQAGVHVPLLIWTPGLGRSRVDGLVAATDLFATIADLAGVASSAEDSTSLLPYLEGATGSLRSTAYTELFEPNGLPFSPTRHERAIRDARFKLIRRDGVVDELYDLVGDPCETEDLYPPQPGSAASRAWQALDERLHAMGVG